MQLKLKLGLELELKPLKPLAPSLSLLLFRLSMALKQPQSGPQDKYSLAGPQQFVGEQPDLVFVRRVFVGEALQPVPVGIVYLPADCSFGHSFGGSPYKMGPGVGVETEAEAETESETESGTVSGFPRIVGYQADVEVQEVDWGDEAGVMF